MPLPFLTPRVERLNADGTFDVLESGGVLGRYRQPIVLLAREMCSFVLFDTGVLPAGRRRQAARLQARMGSPYVAAGSALSRAGRDFGLWWWDLERVNPVLLTRFGVRRTQVRPETLSQPKGRGWRVARLTSGYEAQFWREGALVASAWRRDRFDERGWIDFTRLQRHATPAPTTLPPPQVLPLDPDSEALSISATDITREQAMVLGIATGAAVLLLGVLVLLGQGVRLSSDSRALEAEVLALKAETPALGATRNMELDRQRLVAFRQVEEATNPVSAAGAAIGIVALQNLTPISLDVEDGLLTLSLPYEAVDIADELVADFEGSGYFFDVRPRTEASNDRIIFEMQVRQAAPPLSAGG